MPKAVKISDELARTAAVFAGVEGRSLAGQVEYWANLGRVADENADLPVSFIKEILFARAQVRIGLGRSDRRFCSQIQGPGSFVSSGL